MSFTETKTIHTVNSEASPRPQQQQEQQQQHEKKNLTKNEYEEKLKLKLESSKGFFLNIYNQIQLYWNATRSTFESFWQYPEFRFGVYIFGFLSVIPIGIFFLFVTVVIFSTSVLLSFVWTLCVFSAITLGLVTLVPILILFSIIAAIIIIGYSTWQYLLQFKQQQQINKH